MGQSVISLTPEHSATRCANACFMAWSAHIFSSMAVILVNARVRISAHGALLESTEISSSPQPLYQQHDAFLPFLEAF